MKSLLLTFLFSLFINICHAQTNVSINDKRNIYDEKGDYYFERNKFKKSIAYYNMAYKSDANNYYSVLRKAEAFTSLGLYDQAVECYEIIFETNLRILNEHRLQFAFLLLKNKNIKAYEKWMGKYNEIVANEISKGGYLSSTETRTKMYKDTSIVIVENESILNTAESEISPAVYKNKLVFASTRKNLSGDTGNGYYNMFFTSYSKGGRLGKLNVFNTSLNSTQNESSILFSDNSDRLYITRSKSLNSGLKTYTSNIPAGIGSKLTVNEFSIDGFGNIGHPTLNSKGTKMYFVSNAAGGSGGLDIYSSNLVGGKWSKPVNLGKKINSGKDEMYPHVLNDTLLYFTSAGHNGLGGLDLYSVNLNQKDASPKNLGSKINSKYDDFSLSFSPKGLTGYFSSNRPGGSGKADIYRLHLLDLKVKHAAYRFKRKSFMEDDKINLYLSDGKEYNIASDNKTGFNFGFQPEENYKMVVQHENISANNIINNKKLTPNQKKKALLKPYPIKKTDIKLQAGMKYQFTAGMKPLSSDYKTALNEMSKGYQNSGSSTIDLTALAKELLLREGEIYTIQFVKDDSHPSDYKAKGESSLFIDDQAIEAQGRSFFIVLPLDVEANFNIKTDIAHFKETFNPKKVGKVKVDAAPVYKEETVKESVGFPILVNTEAFSDIVPKGKISAKELTIIPGSMYILTLAKTGDKAGKYPDIVVPLTKGVKYNLGTDAESDETYNKALAQMTAGKTGKNSGELIDISVLSKEMDIASEKNIVFNLIPATKIASQTTSTRNVLTTLDVDGRKYFVTDRVKLQVNLKLPQNKKVNIQTDLTYIQENFDASTIAIKVDTTSFNDDIITDPVFDVIVVNFDLNKYSIRPDARSIIENKVIKELKGDSRLYVTIKGYTDGLGDTEHNEKLSKDRAHSVKDFLARNGIGENRIRTFSFGESLSLKEGVKWEDLDESELQKHRKVEIVIYLPE